MTGWLSKPQSKFQHSWLHLPCFVKIKRVVFKTSLSDTLQTQASAFSFFVCVPCSHCSRRAKLLLQELLPPLMRKVLDAFEDNSWRAIPNTVSFCNRVKTVPSWGLPCYQKKILRNDGWFLQSEAQYNPVDSYCLYHCEPLQFLATDADIKLNIFEHFEYWFRREQFFISVHLDSSTSLTQHRVSDPRLHSWDQGPDHTDMPHAVSQLQMCLPT